MINKLTCDQVADAWDLIRSGLQEAIPADIVGMNPLRESNVLTAILSGGMEVWFCYDKDEENETILLYASIITTIMNDDCTGNRTLYIFSLNAFRDIPPRIWKEGFEALKAYAKSRGCHTMSAHSDEQDIVQYTKRMGANTDFHLITFPLKEGADAI